MYCPYCGREMQLVDGTYTCLVAGCHSAPNSVIRSRTDSRYQDGDRRAPPSGGGVAFGFVPDVVYPSILRCAARCVASRSASCFSALLSFIPVL